MDNRESPVLPPRTLLVSCGVAGAGKSTFARSLVKEHQGLPIFNTSSATCIQRDHTRVRKVGQEVIRYHEGLLRQVLLAAPHEGWQQVRILEEQMQPVYRILIGDV